MHQRETRKPRLFRSRRLPPRPVIWFYLLTSPNVVNKFPIIALSFGAIAFWSPLIFDLLRRIRSRGGAVLSMLWIGLMVFAEARTMLAWLAEGVQGRSS